MEGIINFGYSKSSDFASNFMAYYPELCKGEFFGCGSLGTLPLDSIALKVVEDESSIQRREFYKGEDGKVIKKVTQKEFDRIKEEYENTKRDYQKDIAFDEKDGTYIVPLNFPLGIADIEHYRDLSKIVIKDEAGNVVATGKEAYRQLLTSIPTRIFVSEYEESYTGTYAYNDTYDKDGKLIKAGTNMEDVIDCKFDDCKDWIEFQKKLAEKNLGNVELAGMSNRILESVDLVNAVFGRSVNERFNSYKQLYELLGSKVQARVYEGLDHYGSPFITIGEGEENEVFPSEKLLIEEVFKEDIIASFNSFNNGELPVLKEDDVDNRVSPVFQLCRRYLANGGDIQSLVGLNISDLNKMFIALAETKLTEEQRAHKEEQRAHKEEYIDRIFDNLAADEIESVIRIAKGKDALKDVSDSDARSGQVVGAIGVIKGLAEQGVDKGSSKGTITNTEPEPK